MLSQKRQDAARHAADKQNTETKENKKQRRNRTERLQKHGKTDLEKTIIFETERGSKHFEHGYRSRQGLLRRQASYVHGYDGSVHGQGSEEQTTYYESLFNVKKENMAEAKATVDFWQNSGQLEKRERARAMQAKCPQKFFKKLVNILKKEERARTGSQQKFWKLCRKHKQRHSQKIERKIQ